MGALKLIAEDKATTEGKVTAEDKYQGRNSILLAGVGGSVDAIGYLTFSHLFMGFMTGNTVFLGINLGYGNWGQAGRDFFPILMFVLGATIGNLLIKKVVWALLLEAALLAGTLCWQMLASSSLSAPVAPYLSPPPPAWFATNAASAFFPGVALLATAMGIQSGMFQRVGNQAVGVTAVTGNVLGFAAMLAALTKKSPVDSITGDDLSPTQRQGAVLSIWISYLVCAGIAGLAVKFHVREALLFPLVILAVVIATNGSRSPDKSA